MMDLSEYAVETINCDGEFSLYRGRPQTRARRVDRLFSVIGYREPKRGATFHFTVPTETEA